MKLNWGHVAISIACLIILACHRQGAPSGQVVASVDGQEITLRALRAELAGVSLPKDPQAAKQAEQQVLQTMVIRSLLAKAAHEQGLDKSPDFAIAKTRNDQSLLAQALQSKLENDVPNVPRDEAQSFVSDNPNLFAERKIFDVDQIRTGALTPAQIDKIRPLNTLPDVEALLKRENVAFTRAPAKIDGLAVGSKIVERLQALPAGEVFVSPGTDGFLINQITDTKIQPLTGEPAIAFAMAYLKRQHTQDALQQQIGSIVSKQAQSVKYNPAWAPPKSPMKAAAPAPKSAG